MLLFIITALTSNAQSKVFKEVSDEIASTVRVLMQNNALVGYLTFTRLEAVSEDSFSYKITIMDENLNDIGTVSFKEVSLELHDVSFEQDVICLSYFKSSFLGKRIKTRKTYKQISTEAKFYKMLQFMDLTGKIFKTNEILVKTKATDVNDVYTSGYDYFIGSGNLSNKIQIANIPEIGFSTFYGDDESNYLSLYNYKGDEIWKKKIALDKERIFSLNTSKKDIFILKRPFWSNKIGGEILGYNIIDSTQSLNYTLKDTKTGCLLRVLTINNDPITKNVYVSGIIYSSKTKFASTPKTLTKGSHAGVFTINLNGCNRKEVLENFTYWSDKSNVSIVNTQGKFSETNHYFNATKSFKDFQGNTYFVGTGVSTKAKVGSIISSIITLPLLIPSMIIASQGFTNYSFNNVMFVKQTSKGTLNVENILNVDKVNISIQKRSESLSYIENKSYYFISNEETKTNFIIIDDKKNIVIYNLNMKKIIRTVPHKDGNIQTNIFPAKEGHIMVSEYNKKEKYTRVSIESL